MSRRRNKKVVTIPSIQEIEEVKEKKTETNFKDSLKEFQTIEEDKPILTQDTVEQVKPSIEELNKDYRSFVKNRNISLSPQYYSKSSDSSNKKENSDVKLLLEDFTNRNNKVSKNSRSSIPLTRNNNKLSVNR